VASTGGLGLRVVSEAEFAEFQAWKAELQAVATGGADVEEDGGSEEDDSQEYELGLVALPVRGPRA
jgi:hypothetical protein